jgi:transcription initiation factor TFIID subunit 12
MATNGTNQPPQQQQAPSQPQQSTQTPQQSNNIIAALTSVFKSATGEQVHNDRIASLLLQNMPQLTELAKQGKLNQNQIMQVRSLSAVSL